MELKTKIHAEDNRQDLRITREFDLPVALLFKAYEMPEIVEQWMGTRVLKMENRRHGGFQIQTPGPDGNVAFRANGTIHEFIPNEKIVRTFEMENAPFDVQLEFLEFSALTETTSKLEIHSIYRTAELRDKMLQLPFSRGLSMAHDRLQNIVQNLNK